jgi:ABC-type Na+ efflux pump permease subunit
MPRSLTIAIVLLLAAISYAPCLADSSSSEEVVEVKNGVRFEFKQRLKNLKEQIDTGLDKGWIKADQAAALNTEHDRLLSATKTAKEAGWPKDQVDKLEKGVTAFSAKVSSSLSKSAPSSAASDKTSK